MLKAVKNKQTCTTATNERQISQPGAGAGAVSIGKGPRRRVRTRSHREIALLPRTLPVVALLFCLSEDPPPFLICLWGLLPPTVIGFLQILLLFHARSDFSLICLVIIYFCCDKCKHLSLPRVKGEGTGSTLDCTDDFSAGSPWDAGQPPVSRLPVTSNVLPLIHLEVKV